MQCEKYGVVLGVLCTLLITPSARIMVRATIECSARVQYFVLVVIILLIKNYTVPSM